MAKFDLSWTAPEFEYREKDVSWYWISIIVAVLLIGFSVAAGNLLFGVFVVIAEILFMVWGNRVPDILSFGVTDEELAIQGKRPYFMNEFESWSVDITDESWAFIYFHPHSRVRTSMMVPAPKEKLDTIRTNLKTVLKEVPHRASFTESIEKFLGF